jgi:damage-control phosphatase, subfamily III
MTEEDIKKLQSTGGEHLAATEKNILGNDLEGVWEVVKSLKGGRMDFVLDNAGFELYCDLVYGQLSTPCVLGPV